jgi:hypothetical protein
MPDRGGKGPARRDGGAKTPRPRRAYSTPKVVTYGSVQKLTQSGGSTVAEGSLVAKQMSMCL